MYFTCEQVECQGNLFKSLFFPGLNLFTVSKTRHDPPLTKISPRDNISPAIRNRPYKDKRRFTCSYRIRRNAPPRIPLRVKERGTNFRRLVGAVINRPCSMIFPIRRNRRETAALFRRAIDNCPYNHQPMKYADMMELVDV